MVKFNSAKPQLLLHQPNMKAVKACQGTAEGRDAWGEAWGKTRGFQALGSTLPLSSSVHLGANTIWGFFLGFYGGSITWARLIKSWATGD